MKILCLIIGLYFLSNNTIAQIKGKLTYKIVSDDVKLGRDESKSVIYFNGDKSIEFPVKKSLEEFSTKADENHTYEILEDERPSFMYKNFSKRQLLFDGLVGTHPYLTHDTLSNFKWKITKDKRKIFNYVCTKATTKFRGRNYIAWFTDHVVIQNGPWKFCGLPGLIVKVNDEEEKFIYQLIAIDLKNNFDVKIISVPKDYSKDKSLSFNEYTVLYNKKLIANKKLSKVVITAPNGGYGTATIILPEEMEKF